MAGTAGIPSGAAGAGKYTKDIDVLPALQKAVRELREAATATNVAVKVTRDSFTSSKSTEFSTVMGYLAEGMEGAATADDFNTSAWRDSRLWDEVLHATNTATDQDVWQAEVSAILGQRMYAAYLQGISWCSRTHEWARVSESQRLFSDTTDQIEAIEQRLKTQQSLAVALEKLAIDSYTSYHPMSEVRMSSIEDFTKVLSAIEKNEAKRQVQVNRIGEAQAEVDRLYEDLPDDTARQALIQTQHAKRKEADAEIKFLDSRVLQLRRAGLELSADKSKHEPLKLVSDLKKEKGSTIRKSLEDFMSPRDSEFYIVRTYSDRMFDDYNPITGSFWQYDFESDVPEALQIKFKAQNKMLYTVICKALSPSQKQILLNPIRYGFRKKRKTVQTDDGISLIHAMLSIYIPVSALHQEQLIGVLTDCSESFKKGSPKNLINKVLRPVLDEILWKQIPIKGILTVQPIMRELSKRHDKLRVLAEHEDYNQEAQASENVAPLLSQLFTDIVSVVDEIEESEDTKPSELWGNYSAKKTKAKSKAQVADESNEAAGQGTGKSKYAKQRRAKAAKAAAAENDEQETTQANWTNTGGKGGKGKGNKSGKGNKGGKGAKQGPHGRFTTPCAANRCQDHVDPNGGDYMPELCTYHVGSCRRQGYYYDRQNQKVYADGKLKATAREKAFAAEIVEEVTRGRSTSRSTKSKRSRSPERSPSRGRSRSALESDDDENIEDRHWRRLRSRSTTAQPERSRLFSGLFAKRQQ